MYKFLNNNLIAVFFSISILILFSAYFIEYILGYEACNLCLLGRIPYFFVVVFSFIFFFFKKLKKLILVFIFLSFVSSFLIAFYHVGVEQGFFDESLVCQIKSLKQNTSASELLRELKNSAPKSCKEVDFKILGLSLATINLFNSLVLSTITLKYILKNEKN